MRVLLVNPPNTGRSIAVEKYGLPRTTQIFRGEPLSLEVLAGSLPGHEVEILDLKAPGTDLAASLSRFRPQLVGFTAVTCEANAALRMCSEVKRADPAAVTVVGGIHASGDPGFFNREDVDYVAVGLGHESLPELVAGLERGSDPARPNGMARTRPGQAGWSVPRRTAGRETADPAPRYDLVQSYRSHYFIPALKLAMGYVVAAYGCPYDCSFCCVGNLTAGRYLPRRIEDILRDLRALGDAPLVRFVDANTFGDVRWTRRLCEAIAAAGIRKHFVLDVRADTVVQEAELLRAWRQVGLRAVIVGFEETDDRRLASWDKRAKADDVARAIEILKSLGISIIGDFIVSPDYGAADFDALERYIRESRIDLPVVAVLTPLPGTRLFEAHRNRIVISDLDYYTLGNAVTGTALPEKEFYERLTALQARVTAKAAI